MSLLQRGIPASSVDHSIAGHWRVLAHPPYKEPVDVSMFRGMPVKLGDFSFTDPFGPSSMTIVFPQITIFDALGQGDLSWLRKQVNVDVIWDGGLPSSYPFGLWVGDTWTPMWRWEGYIVSFAYAAGGLTVQLKGAMLQLDMFLAKPEYIERPLPYEWAIQRQFLNKPSLRLSKLKVVWPSWWTRTYAAPRVKTPSYLIPAGVTPGNKWSGLLTRATGSWDPVLTSYIRTMLGSMYTERGRWTMDLQANRQPVLFHLDFGYAPETSTVVIDPVTPDTVISLTEDWEQSMTTVFGQGTSISGVTYSGMSVNADGDSTDYIPLAASRQVYPTRVSNGWMDEQVMEREVMVQMQAGLSADDAAIVARAHLTRFADPGVTGTVTIGSDPMMNGSPISRFLVRAGMEVHIPYLFGRPEGIMLHVSESSHSLSSGTTTLTVDSKRRDALTVEEVRTRGRDALSVSRMLIAGSYKPVVEDTVFPWSYAQGSGYIPSNKTHSAVKLFEGMPGDVTFPWDEWTTQHPPSDPRWRSCYLSLGRAQPNASKNWVVQHSASGSDVGIPIRMAQAGGIRLLQVAAYDRNGNVFPVAFHISFYYLGSVNVLSMPHIPSNQVSLFPPYAAAQSYPYIRDGWETVMPNGQKVDPNVPQPTQTVGLIREYGNFYEKAGYYPGSYASGDAKTGLLVDETPWTFDLTSQGDATWDQYKAERNLTNPKAGIIYAMIYCDEQGSNEVFFLGRMYRAEPGSAP